MLWTALQSSGRRSGRFLPLWAPRERGGQVAARARASAQGGPAGVPVGGALIGVGGAEDGFFVPVPAGEREADRQTAFAKAAGHGDDRNAGDVEGTGVAGDQRPEWWGVFNGRRQDCLGGCDQDVDVAEELAQGELELELAKRSRE